MMFEDNIPLIKAAQSGDADALEKLVSSNMGLVRSLAARFRDRGIEYEDLMQIGTMGMIKAIRSFDVSYNTAFSTYAVPLICGEIRRFLRDDGLVKVGRAVKKHGIDAMRAREAFRREHGREPKMSELAALCGLSEEELTDALEAITPARSLSEPASGNSDDADMTLEGMIADGENRIDGITDRIALREALASLPDIQRQLVFLRFFRELSQQKTGEILGMTQVKVSREEKKIMEKLRAAIVG